MLIRVKKDNIERVVDELIKESFIDEGYEVVEEKKEVKSKYDKMKKEEIMVELEANAIDYDSKMTKAELIALLEEE